MTDARAGSIRARAQLVSALVDEFIEEVATGPNSYLVRVEHNNLMREDEWFFDERAEVSARLEPYLDELCERAVARGLCPSDWFDDPARRFSHVRCERCGSTAIDGGSSREDEVLCLCVTARPNTVERVVRMLALPPATLVAQEHVARGRWPQCVGIVYVPRYAEVERSVKSFDGDEVWLVRADPALVGVRWPRLYAP